jgi:transposase
VFTVPKAIPEEFRRNVIAVARKGDASIRQVAKDFGISGACLHRCLKIADREDGVDPEGTRAGASREDLPRLAVGTGNRPAIKSHCALESN